MAKKKAQTLDDRIDAWAEQGEPGKIARDLIDNGRYHNNKRRTLGQMDWALEKAADKGIEHLINISFRELLTFSASLLLRAQYIAATELADWDAKLALGRQVSPEFLNERALPVVQALQQHLASLARVYGSVRHTLNMGKADEDQVDMVEEAVMKLAQKTRQIADRSMEERLEPAEQPAAQPAEEEARVT
jgi:hypothetical protein